MKKIAVIIAMLCATMWNVQGQTTIWSENFESGVGAWSLDPDPATPVFGDNIWIVNNVYTGGTYVVMGMYPTPVPNVANQPSGITGSPNSHYLHIVNTGAVGSGIANANFLGGFGTDNTNAISPVFSTTPHTGVKLSYWWLNNGVQGDVYYSTDNGTTWTHVATHTGSTVWQQATYTIPNLDNKPQVKLKFNWNNGSTGNDPAFSVDDIHVYTESGTPPPPPTNTLTNLVPSPAYLCEGYGTNTQASINFTPSGTFNAGNQYIAELSDASGSFASPTQIGMISSTQTNQVVTLSPITISASLAVGTGYKIRIRSTDPAVISDLVSFTVLPKPVVDLGSDVTTCSAGQPITLSPTTTPSGGTPTYNILPPGGSGLSGNVFTPSVAGVGEYKIECTYETLENCYAFDTIKITVQTKPVVSLGTDQTICSDGQPITLNVTATPSGGTPTYVTIPAGGTGLSGNVFTPSVAGAGEYEIECKYETLDGCEAFDTIKITVQTCDCSSGGVAIVDLPDTVEVCGSSYTIPDGKLSNISGTPTWSKEGTFGTIQDAQTETPTFSTDTDTIIYYKLYVQDLCAKDSIPLKIIQKPKISIENPDLCDLPKIVNAHSLDSLLWSQGGTDSISLTFSNDTVVNIGEVKKYSVEVMGSEGTYWVKYETKNMHTTCVYTDSIKITFPSVPIVSVQDDSICLGATYQLYATSSEENLTYTWNTGFVGNPLIVNQVGTYSVKGKNACFESAEATAEISLKTCETEEIPNVLSMNPLSPNKSWFVPNKGAKNFECLIFNRWGDVIFELKNADDKWYGKDKSGNEVSDGVYFYKLTASYENGTEEVKHGFIQVIR